MPTLDAIAKAAMLEWSAVTKLYGTGNRLWLRAQPVGGLVTHPRITFAGATAGLTQPDGMYIRLSDRMAFVDVIAVEVCGSWQNLNDKRARYSPSTQAMLVSIPTEWLQAVGSSGGKYAGKTFAEASGAFAKPKKAYAGNPPVRMLKTLYVLPDDKFADLHGRILPQGHERFTRLSSLGSFTAAPFREFLKGMAYQAHFYPKTGIAE